MGNIIFTTGVISLLAGVVLVLFAFKIIKPVIRTEKSAANYQNWLTKYGKSSKFIAMALIFIGTYNIIQNNPDAQVISEGQSNAISVDTDWSKEDKDKLTNECVRMYMSQEETAGSDEKMATNYCACTTEKMTGQFSIADLIAHDSLTRDQKIMLYEPVVQTCIKDLETELQGKYNK